MYEIETFVFVLILSSETKASKTAVPVFFEFAQNLYFRPEKIRGTTIILKNSKRILLP